MQKQSGCKMHFRSVLGCLYHCVMSRVVSVCARILSAVSVVRRNPMVILWLKGCQETHTHTHSCRESSGEQNHTSLTDCSTLRISIRQAGESVKAALILLTELISSVTITHKWPNELFMTEPCAYQTKPLIAVCVLDSGSNSAHHWGCTW